jgi:hypothetical protein
MDAQLDRLPKSEAGASTPLIGIDPVAEGDVPGDVRGVRARWESVAVKIEPAWLPELKVACRSSEETSDVCADNASRAGVRGAGLEACERKVE